jgi:hypothetical protein
MCNLCSIIEGQKAIRDLASDCENTPLNPREDVIVEPGPPGAARATVSWRNKGRSKQSTVPRLALVKKNFPSSNPSSQPQKFYASKLIALSSVNCA